MTAAAEQREAQAVRPAADILETAESILIRLDMPGVTRDGLTVTVEADDLLVEGRVAEYAGERIGTARLPRHYRRLFGLSDLVARDGVSARLRDGVLELTLPKAERVRPRVIPIDEG